MCYFNLQIWFGWHIDLCVWITIIMHSIYNRKHWALTPSPVLLPPWSNHMSDGNHACPPEQPRITFKQPRNSVKKCYLSLLKVALTVSTSPNYVNTVDKFKHFLNNVTINLCHHCLSLMIDATSTPVNHVLTKRQCNSVDTVDKWKKQNKRSKGHCLKTITLFTLCVNRKGIWLNRFIALNS